MPGPRQQAILQRWLQAAPLSAACPCGRVNLAHPLLTSRFCSDFCRPFASQAFASDFGCRKQARRSASSAAGSRGGGCFPRPTRLRSTLRQVPSRQGRRMPAPSVPTRNLELGPSRAPRLALTRSRPQVMPLGPQTSSSSADRPAAAVGAAVVGRVPLDNTSHSWAALRIRSLAPSTPAADTCSAFDKTKPAALGQRGTVVGQRHQP